MSDQSLTNTGILENVEFDDEGYMVDPHAWTPEIAEAIAAQLGITLTDRHWVVINFARKEFEANGEPPTLRRITKQTDVNTKELYQLFPGGAAKVAAKIAGLGKPTGCI
ncbi:MAG TPA: TusE/DsrC/DsvC family sulfur relay protein [Chloroflexi bacterium]|nr:TusE/DsrC/DsvC family sulfur relay protein [Chloroflexota bacterium]